MCSDPVRHCSDQWVWILKIYSSTRCNFGRDLTYGYHSYLTQYILPHCNATNLVLVHEIWNVTKSGKRGQFRVSVPPLQILVDSFPSFPVIYAHAFARRRALKRLRGGGELGVQMGVTMDQATWEVRHSSAPAAVNRRWIWDTRACVHCKTRLPISVP